MKIQKFNRQTTESNGTLVLEDVTPEEYDFIFQWVRLVNEHYPFEEYLKYVLLKRRLEENESYVRLSNYDDLSDIDDGCLIVCT